MSKAYSSNLTKEQWELIEPLIPEAKTGGRKREVDMWSILNAMWMENELLARRKQLWIACEKCGDGI